MYTIRKLKPDTNFNMILLPIGILMIGVLINFAISLTAMFTYFAVCFFIYGLYTFITFVKTHNSGYIVSTLYLAAAGMMCLTTPASIQNRSRPSSLVFLAIMLFFGVWMVFLALNKKMKWRGREILELAAQSVDATGNGYTARPLPAGKTDFSRDQVLAFTAFCLKNMVAVPYVGQEKTVFVPIMMGREFPFIIGLKSDYTDETWVAFHYDGHVTVNISHRDYLEYKEAFSFEPLCNALGDLFIEFMNMFLRGEGVRIIDRLNAVGFTFS